MMPTKSTDHISSTLRTCCDLIENHGQLGIVDLLVLTGIKDGCMRKAVTRGVELGYLVEGPKTRGTKKNRRKSWVRTEKLFPREVKKVEDAPVAVNWSGPFRHWMDEALFGPAPRAGGSVGQVTVRVIQQPMDVTDEVEA